MWKGDPAQAVIDMIEAASGGHDLDEADFRAGLTHLGIAAGRQLEIVEHLRYGREEIARLRRREHELTALFSSARDLAEVRDFDQLLIRLVERAHEMMGADVTYLSEFDEVTRDLHVRETVGTITPEFRALRVPAGAGLASRVAETRSAHWVPVYRDDVANRHDHTIDDAVTAEGICSILGVPMLSDGRVLGVLFAATRQRHTFDQSEIALLSALADHASVVLQTMTTLSRLRASEDEARTALADLTVQIDARDRSTSVHEELIRAVLLGSGLPHVAETLSTALGRTVTIIDSNATPLATSTPSGTSVEGAVIDFDSAVRTAVSSSRRTGRCCHLPAPTAKTFAVVAAVTAGELYLGAVLAGPAQDRHGAMDDLTIERGAQVAALLILQQNMMTDADRRARGELISDLIESRPGRMRDVQRRARRHRVDITQLETLLTVVVASEKLVFVEHATSTYFGESAVVGEYAGVITAVITGRDSLESGRKLREHLAIAAHDAPILVVATPPARTIEDFSARFDTAQRTTTLLRALGVVDGAVTTVSYIPYLAMFGTDAEGVQDFVQNMIGPVIEYDHANRTDLLVTLRAFVRHDASPTKAARALRYHTNTVLQRLDRVRMLLGGEWRHDEQFFRISTAVRLEELKSEVGTDRRSTGI